VPAVNTRDLDLTPILAELAETWPEEWVAAARTRGAFHGVALLDGVATRIAVGDGHAERSRHEAANHLAVAGLGLPFRTPTPVRAPHTTVEWTATAYERLDGAALGDGVSWDVARRTYLPVLEALRSVPAAAGSALRPVRAWCGGDAWGGLALEAASGQPPEVRLLAERLVSRLGACEQEGTPGVVHGDLTPFNILLAGGAVGLIDLDFAAVGDPAIDLGWLVRAFAGEELRRDLPVEELRRARLHRAAGPLQLAVAARTIGNGPLEAHALASFADRAAEAAAALEER